MQRKSIELVPQFAVADTNVYMSTEHISFLKEFIAKGNKLIVPITSFLYLAQQCFLSFSGV